jgi:hypothetical protein
VARYVRNGGSLYDDLIYETSVISDASLYKNSTRVIFMDIKTSAPVGTSINLTFLNGQMAISPYPSGRHSVYSTTTTSNSNWQRLSFAYSFAPDNSVSDFSINQFSISFKPNSTTSNTYYIDNIRTNCGFTLKLTDSKLFLTQKEKENHLYWKSEGQTNVEIQKSYDGEHFFPVEKIIESKMSFIDREEIDCCYRIYNEALNEYSNIVCTLNKDVNRIKIFPNPVSDFLYIKGASSLEATSITIKNISGFEKEYRIEGSIEKINVSNLVPGSYILTLNNHNFLFIKL